MAMGSAEAKRWLKASSAPANAVSPAERVKQAIL